MFRSRSQHAFVCFHKRIVINYFFVDQSSLIVMASHEQGVIEQATQLTGPNTVTAEDQPLLQKNKKLQAMVLSNSALS